MRRARLTSQGAPEERLFELPLLDLSSRSPQEGQREMTA
ncbi:hypothetical protein PAMC26510_15220 [Caballeronia sordidicola]|uniref:Uncharacterized protein n=1 Tax=Caballeronia sordidicola TaxID=196367 RepID=A0A242MUC0_CABSO|nr:hypothetical protein PAMC26510_15220 [Caballeronia sordidicola]